MDTFLIATRNAHKVEEIGAMLAPAVRCVGLRGFHGVPDFVEDADTFVGNASKKALGLVRWLQGQGRSQLTAATGDRVWVLADDSGLQVDHLGGAPGVHSARFAHADNPTYQGNSPDADNNAKLLRLLKDVPDSVRRARFRCVLALVPLESGAAGQEPLIFEGTCEGRIARVASGAGGFGYDPLFIPDGETASFAELGADVKNRMSHRARALESLRRYRAGGR